MIHKPYYYSSYYIAFFMAAISGFSDVFGFIALDSLFTAHVTGNIVIVISSLIYDIQGVVPKIIAIPFFMLFAAIISAIIEHHGHTRKMLYFWLSFEMILFFTLMLTGVILIPKLEKTSISYISLTLLPICAMAIHNTLLNTYMSKLPPCTVMTGNLTQFVVYFTALCLSKLPGKLTPLENSRNAVKRFGNVLLGFMLGGLLAAVGFVYLGFSSLIIVIILLIICSSALTRIKVAN